MLDQIVSATANLTLAVTGLLVVRAYFPRDGWPASTAARSFHIGFLVSALAAALNAAAWGVYRLAVLTGADGLADVLGQAFRYGDGFWKIAGAAAFLSLLLAKLAALEPEERGQWNLLTVAFHPDQDALAVRIYGALAGMTGRVARSITRKDT